MTFIAGFKCADGIILCTDSLEADGFTKRAVRKIRPFGTTDWQVAIAGAGGAGIIDKFCDEVSAALPRKPYDPALIESTIEDTLLHFRSRYQADDEHFEIIVGTHCTRVIDRRLYRSGTGHLSPIGDHIHIGVGHSLWRFLTEMFYEKGNSVDDNRRLAAFIMKQAIEYVDGVEGPVQLASYTFGNRDWKISTIWPTLYSFSFDTRLDLKTAMRDFWKKVTPPSLSQQAEKFKTIRAPGDELTFLQGVEPEKLRTVSGRNKNEGFLYGNRDRLRKRALLERERDKVSSQNQQPPASHKIRT